MSLLNFLKKTEPSPTPLVAQSDLLKLGQHHPLTPDFWELELQQFCLMFVADECKEGHRAYDILDTEDASKMCVAYTAKSFTMFKKSMGKFTFPVILPPRPDLVGPIGRQPMGLIKGEVFAVRPRVVVDLDNYKHNGVVFQRQRVQLDIPYRAVEESRRNKENVHVFGEWKHFRKQNAWMYVGIPEYFFWADYAGKTFSPMKLKRPSDNNKKPFYEFTEEEAIK